MQSEYDIVVVGGGPAGSVAARFASQMNVSVALFEKDGEIGIPVRCAEATSDMDLACLIEVKREWIANYVTKARLFAPSGDFVEIPLPNRGIILHRRLFDSGLAEEAAKQGVAVFTKAFVSHVEFNSDLPVVTVNYCGEPRQVRTKIVIAADGVESRVGRWAGIRTQTALKDIESCAQSLLGNIEVQSESIDFYFTSRWAPGGYAWVFPKGERVANVGLGVNCAKPLAKPPVALLNDFIETQFPQGARLSTVAGGVPVARALKQLVADNLLIVGDAAHQANPVTGGGILAAVTAGKIAGQVAGEAIRCGNYQRSFLKKYQQEWDRTVGKDYARFYLLKEWMTSLTDQDLNDIASSLKRLSPEEINLLTVFRVALVNHPRLLFHALKLFASYS